MSKTTIEYLKMKMDNFIEVKLNNDVSFESHIKKLQEESIEAEEGTMEELADVLLCLIACYSKKYPDFPFQYLIDHANLKIKKNMNRDWIKTENGTWKHK